LGILTFFKLITIFNVPFIFSFCSLSKIHEKPLVDDNPATDDLSDPNRPQKLGVFYSELYDNEWTDAFDALTNSGYDDKEAIITLRLTLIVRYKFHYNLHVGNFR
jgi:hypothetical protein